MKTLTFSQSDQPSGLFYSTFIVPCYLQDKACTSLIYINTPSKTGLLLDSLTSASVFNKTLFIKLVVGPISAVSCLPSPDLLYGTWPFLVNGVLSKSYLSHTINCSFCCQHVHIPRRKLAEEEMVKRALTSCYLK